MTAQVYGLVLTGGRSTRMGQDKAALAIHGRTQLARTWAVLEPLVARCYVSLRADQSSEPARAGYAAIADQTNGPKGPLAGITAAQAAHPNVAWLVVACDLPNLDAQTLQHLLARRDPAQMATAFRSTHDQLPEPLCAIYEPQAAAAMQTFIAAGGNCPRKFLIQSNATLLDQPSLHALDNVNTPQDLAAITAQSMSTTASTSRTVQIQYFALLREQANKRDEKLQTTATTARDLYTELASRYGFTLAPEQLKVAINTRFCDWLTPLNNNDAVVFIPPVAGG
jgi:molybdenum cofactor guanylyltransferase